MRQEQEEFFGEIERALVPLGLALLELQVSRHRGSTQARATVKGAGGTGTDECVKAHRTIARILLENHGIAEPFIEVSSPGIDRPLKSARDFAVFAGERIRFIRDGETEWEKGRLLGIEGDILSIDTAEGKLAIPLSGLAKARLDSTTEGE